MSESFESQEVPVVRLSQAEFDLLSKFSFPENEEERARIDSLLSDKGIQVDSGDIVVEIDGKQEKITTDPKDFGTIIM